MYVYLNLEKFKIGPATKTLSDLAKIIAIENTPGVALSVNNKIFPKASWSTISITEDDHIKTIVASQGG